MAVSEQSPARQRMPERVLIVDDDTNVLDAYRRRLGRALHVEVCNDPVDALRLIDGDQEYAVIISDFLMPKLNGVQFLAKCREKSPGSVRMMLTGISDFGTSVDAVNAGAVFRFLLKPCPPEVLSQALIDGIRQYRLEQAETNLVRNTLREAILLAVDVGAVADPETFADTRRLAAAVREVAASVDPDRSVEIEIAWLLSRFGQLTVPAEVLSKQRRGEGLTEQEAALVSAMRRASVRVAKDIPQLETIAAMIEGDSPGARGKRLSGSDAAAGAAILRVFTAIAELKAGGVEDAELASKLRAQDGGLDSGVLDAAKSYFDRHGAEEGFPTPVAIEELEPGDQLSAAVTRHDGTVLVAAGTELSYLLIERIRNFSTAVGVKEPITVLRPGVTVELGEPGENPD
jgi:FixJ family two-component response regulator